jgi:hypothetical protein
MREAGAIEMSVKLIQIRLASFNIERHGQPPNATYLRMGGESSNKIGEMRAAQHTYLNSIRENRN